MVWKLKSQVWEIRLWVPFSRIWTPMDYGGLWSVIVPVAWLLTDRLNRWSPSTGGGNESGLSSPLLSAPYNTLLVSPSTYLGHLTFFDVTNANSEYVCPWVYMWAKASTFQEFTGSTAAQFHWIILNLILSLTDRMYRSSRVSYTLRDSHFSCFSSLSFKLPLLLRIDRGLDRVTQSQMTAMICLALKVWEN